MSTFNEREGIDPPKRLHPQVETLDYLTRNKLINSLFLRCSNELDLGQIGAIWSNVYQFTLDALIEKIDDLKISRPRDFLEELRKQFWKNYIKPVLLSSEPYQVYQLIECVAAKNQNEQSFEDYQLTLPLEERTDAEPSWLSFRKNVNKVLDKYWCAYRIDTLSGNVIPAASPYEQAVIEMALFQLEQKNYSSPLSHLQQARAELALFNSSSGYAAAKSAIDALEGFVIQLCAEITQVPRYHTFDKALSKVRGRLIHERMCFVLEQLYIFRNNTVGHGNPTVHRNDVSFYEGRKIFVIVCALIDDLIFRQENGTLNSLNKLNQTQQRLVVMQVEEKLQKERQSLLEQYNIQ